MLITRDNLNITVPLKEPHTLWHHPNFQVNLKIVILVTGWNSNINLTNDAVNVLYEAYRCRDDYNFVVGNNVIILMGDIRVVFILKSNT